jgi:mannitol/fructose-specific phosphotransferase system IIA component (Ntr-type)
VLAQRFPELDLLSLTLSEAEVGQYVAEAAEQAGDEASPFAFPPERLSPNLAPDGAEALLRTLLAPAFDDAPGDAERLVRELLQATGRPSAPEVGSGAVLYHTSTALVDRPALYVGACPEGAPLAGTGEPARVVLALLAPRDTGPDAYRRLVTVAAQTVREAATVEALAQAGSAEAMREVLHAALHEGGA